MTAILAALAVLLAPDSLTRRIEESNAAAQALQGPLDGAWTLRDGAGRVLYIFQVSDGPGSLGPARGVWRDQVGAMGRADFESIGGRRLRVQIAGAALAICLTQTGGGWRCLLAGHGAVTLTRGLAAPQPPV